MFFSYQRTGTLLVFTDLSNHELDSRTLLDNRMHIARFKEQFKFERNRINKF
jgi:hypothetical protein